jgi:hypothetical protein
VKTLATLSFCVFATWFAAEHTYPPKDGYIPNSVTAIKVAEAVLTPVYGEQQVVSERPFNATLVNGVWKVTGTLYCPGAAGSECDGGVAEMDITKADARIVSMSHGK